MADLSDNPLEKAWEVAAEQVKRKRQAAEAEAVAEADRFNKAWEVAESVLPELKNALGQFLAAMNEEDDPGTYVFYGGAEVHRSLWGRRVEESCFLGWPVGSFRTDYYWSGGGYYHPEWKSRTDTLVLLVDGHLAHASEGGVVGACPRLPRYNEAFSLYSDLIHYLDADVRYFVYERRRGSEPHQMELEPYLDATFLEQAITRMAGLLAENDVRPV